jgi:hypothetical protein
MTHETDDAGEPTALPGEIEVPREASIWRRVAIWCGLLVVAAGLAVAGCVAGYSAITSDAFVNGASYSSDGTDLQVSYVSAGGCDQMVRVRASETDDAVVLDLVSWKLPFMPDAPRALACLVTFHLSQPVGDRELRMANGEKILGP